MAISYTQLATLEDPDFREIFKQVVQNRSIGFIELAERVKVPRDKVRANLKVLKDQCLIEEVASPASVDIDEDYKTIYVTADGLEASRKVGI